MTTIDTDQIDTPIGPLTVFVLSGSLCGIEFSEGATTLRNLERRYGSLSRRSVANPAGVSAALRAYFQGDLPALDGIPVETGGTPFQQRVWQALRRIPAGTATSYSRLASEIGSPKAVRAVGAANGRNPVPIVVPCHRVIAADGSLWGYGGGLERKRWLLEHEGVTLKQSDQATLAFLP